MHKNELLIFIIIAVLFLFLPSLSWSQLILGQYEDEAPFRTWNSLGITTGSSLGMGGTHFSLRPDCSVALTNPSLLSDLPGFSFIVNTSLDSASFFKYSIVNTGVLSTRENLSHGILAIDFVGASINLNGWAFSLSMGIIENYDRPSAGSEYTFENRLYYSLDFRQEGLLRNINLSFAGRPHRRFSFGIGLNFVFGNLEKNIEETWPYDDVTITDIKTHDYSGFYLNGGLTLNLSSKLAAGIVFRTPYSKKAESYSLQRYTSPHGDTDIKIEASAENDYKQPFVVGVGFNYRFSERLIAVSDFTYFQWSAYSIKYFEEEPHRDFKDILKIGAGIEYWTSAKVFQKNISIPLRAGLSYDPQPLKDPHSYYFSLSFGTGAHWGKFFLDVGILLGIERGSGQDLSGKRFAVTLGYM